MSGLQDQVIWFPGMTLEQAERIVIQKAVQFTQNNKAEAARMLGIAETTIFNKLRQYEKDDAALADKEADELEKRQAIQAQLRGTMEIDPKTGGATFKDISDNGNGHHQEPAAQASAKAATKAKPSTKKKSR